MDEAEQQIGLAWSRYLLDRLHADGGDPLGEPDGGDGRCDDCGRDVLARWQVGRFLTCRTCTSSRRRAADQLQREEARHERSDDNPAGERAGPQRGPPSPGGTF